MEGLIIYSSKYGATQQYAEWLGQELKLPVELVDNLEKKQISSPDYLMIGSSVYSGKLRISPWLKDHARDIINKKLFFFIVCGTGPDEQSTRDKIVKESIPADIRNQ